jgi:molybdate-binding protein
MDQARAAYGLALRPLTVEHFDLVVAAAHAGTREVQGLLKVLSSAWLLDQLASCPDMTRPGAGSTSRSCRRTPSGHRAKPATRRSAQPG